MNVYQINVKSTESDFLEIKTIMAFAPSRLIESQQIPAIETRPNKGSVIYKLKTIKVR